MDLLRNLRLVGQNLNVVEKIMHVHVCDNIVVYTDEMDGRLYIFRKT